MYIQNHSFLTPSFLYIQAYLSILYLHVPDNFYIILRGRVVEYHNIVNDLKFPEFIEYKPRNVEVNLSFG